MDTLITPSSVLATPLAEIKAALRLDHSTEDALLSAWARSATAQAEAFLGFSVLPAVFEYRAGAGGVANLSAQPVREIVSVRVDGALTTAYRRLNDCTVELAIPAENALVIRYVAGKWQQANEVPEPIRLGIARQVVHLYTHRDAPDIPVFPASVLAMWQSYRIFGLVR